MLETCLTQLGFNEKEASVLMTLVEHLELTAADISEKTTLARSTTYSLLDSLIQKGVVAEKHHEGVTHYVLSGLSAFQSIVDRDREELVRRERTLKQLMDFLSPALTEPLTGVPKIRFYSGKQNILQMLYDHYPAWRKSCEEGDFTWWGYQDDTFVQQYRSWLDMMWKTTHPNEKVNLFSNESEEERQRRIPGRVIRALPGKLLFTSTIWVTGEFIVMISTRAKPHYAFQFVGPIFAANLRQVFHFMWESAEPAAKSAKN